MVPLLPRNNVAYLNSANVWTAHGRRVAYVYRMSSCTVPSPRLPERRVPRCVFDSAIAFSRALAPGRVKRCFGVSTQSTPLGWYSSSVCVIEMHGSMYRSKTPEVLLGNRASRGITVRPGECPRGVRAQQSSRDGSPGAWAEISD